MTLSIFFFQIYSLVDKEYELKRQAQAAYKKFLKAYRCHKLGKIFDLKTLKPNLICKSFGFPKL